MAFYIFYRPDGFIDRALDTNGEPITVPGLTRVKLDDPIEITAHRVVAGRVVAYTPEQQQRYDSRPVYARWDAAACDWHDPRDNAALIADARRERDSRLLRTDWTQLPDVPEATQSRYQAYRQALRDVPDQPGFPTAIQWPEQP